MATLRAHLGEMPVSDHRFRQPRRKLCLEAPGALGAGVVANVLIHDISLTGLLIESPIPLVPGEIIEVELPHAGESSAKIIWSSDQRYGCKFETPISAATLSAVQLRGISIRPNPAGEDAHLSSDAITISWTAALITTMFMLPLMIMAAVPTHFSIGMIMTILGLYPVILVPIYFRMKRGNKILSDLR